MVEKTIKCGDCGTEFTFTVHPKYMRKYCDKCSKERKKAWENRHEMKFEDGED